MNAVATVGQKRGGFVLRTMRGVLAVGVLLAVPALGLTHFSGDLFASFQDGNAEVGTPLAFDAPAATVAQLQASAAAAKTNRATPEALQLNDWRDTSLESDLIDFFASFDKTVFRHEVFFDFLLMKGGVSPEAIELLLLAQLTFNYTLENLKFETLSKVASASPSY